MQDDLQVQIEVVANGISLTIVGANMKERGIYHIGVFLSFIEHKSSEIVCNPEVIIWVDVAPKLPSKVPN